MYRSKFSYNCAYSAMWTLALCASLPRCISITHLRYAPASFDVACRVDACATSWSSTLSIKLTLVLWAGLWRYTHGAVFRLEGQNFRSKDWFVFNSFSPRTKNVSPQKTQCRKNCRNGQSKDWLVIDYFSPFEDLSVWDWKLKQILIPESMSCLLFWLCWLIILISVAPLLIAFNLEL